MNKKLTPILWTLTGILILGMLFARAIFPELTWLTIVLAVPLVASLAFLIQQNREALKSRSAAFGLNSVITICLVLAIVGVLNFMASRYPFKWDLTKNKIHTLSDQTKKLVKGLDKEVKATLFAKLGEKEKFRPLLDNYKGLNPKFEVEYVDPDKEPTRAKAAGVRKYGTLVLTVGARDSQVDDVTEEKITNAMIKLLKDKSPTLCAITGHGEKNFAGTDAEGYVSVKTQLTNQAYQVKDVNLVQENKIPEDCDAIAILGPTKAFFEPEVKLLRDYLDAGGRAVIAMDLNIRGAGAEYAPELQPVLADWHVKPDAALVVDPISRMFQLDASVAILTTFQKDNPITKEFGGVQNCAFPFSRPLDIMPDAPAGMNVQWLAQTTPKSFGVTELKELATGKVTIHPERDQHGPLTVAIAVSGKQKDSKATKNTRLVVFGSSQFANNNYGRFGNNMDFFVNATSWVMEDESMISIRSKEDGPGKVELSQKTGTFIAMLTIFLIPGLIAAMGVGIWWMRRRL